MTTNNIDRVEVKGLFGLYAYVLPQEGSFSNATILYGDNGAGKSTLLRLVYHLLSAAGNRGHRNELFRAKFDYLCVHLSSGFTVTAKPEGNEDAPALLLEIREGERVLARWDFTPRDHSINVIGGERWEYHLDPEGETWLRRAALPPESRDEDGAVPQGESAFLKTLNDVAPKMFILNADRRLSSDTVADPSDEVELRRLMRYDTPKSINQLLTRSREIGLTQALSSASKWISRKAISGTNKGSTNVHQVYADVVSRIVTPAFESPIEESENDADSIVGRLKEIEQRMQDHANYELTTTLSMAELSRALENQDLEKAQLAAEVLQPYVQSLARRLEAVEPIYQVIDKFVRTINNFLSDKALGYSLAQGFRISNQFDEELKAEHLSSGEQQLLLLFCYVITARDKPSVFMIDEPEISLNIKWQRQLVRSLLDITEGSDIQFVFASHSMELLAQHRERVVRMGGAGG